MKFKDLFWYSTILCSLLGCGTSSQDESPGSETLSASFEGIRDKILTKPYWEAERELQGYVKNYLFTQAEFDPDAFKPYISNAILSRHAKTLVKNIWSSLQTLGFEGYSPTVLDRNPVRFSYERPEMPAGSRMSGVSYKYRQPSFINRPFHEKVMTQLMDGTVIRYLIKNIQKETDVFSPMFIGLSINGQHIRLHDTSIYDPRPYGSQYVHNYYLAYETDKSAPIREVPKADYLKWNQVFIDALKADPFFKQFFEPAALPDGSGSVSLLSARKGSTGADATSFNVNGVSGAKVELGLPLYVQLKGSVDHGKSTNLTTGTVTYKLSNTVVGALQSYANAGAGFGTDGCQLETSVVASHSFGPLFIEGQLGSVSATDVRFKDWSGVRSQLTLGVDTAWGSPFVQVTHRDFGDRTDMATYAGLEVDLSELKAESYSFSTHVLTKIGHHSVHGLTGAVEGSGALTLNSGLSFSTNLTLATAAEPSARLNFTLER